MTQPNLKPTIIKAIKTTAPSTSQLFFDFFCSLYFVTVSISITLVPHQPYPDVSRLSSTAPDASSDLQSSYDYSSDTSDTPDAAADNRIIHSGRIGEALDYFSQNLC